MFWGTKEGGGHSLQFYYKCIMSGERYRVRAYTHTLVCFFFGYVKVTYRIVWVLVISSFDNYAIISPIFLYGVFLQTKTIELVFHKESVVLLT